MSRAKELSCLRFLEGFSSILSQLCTHELSSAIVKLDVRFDLWLSSPLIMAVLVLLGVSASFISSGSVPIETNCEVLYMLK